MHDDAISGDRISLPISTFKVALISLGWTINFIDNRLQCFENNYDRIIVSYKENMSELFKTIPTLLPQKILDDY